MDELNLLERALSRASVAEVYSESTNATTVDFEANLCHAVATRATSGTALRVFWNGRVGFSSTTNPDRPDDLIDAAVETARFGEPAAFELPPPRVLPEVTTECSPVCLMPTERIKLAGDEVIGLCRSQVPEMKVDLAFRRALSTIRLVNSSGFDAGYDRAVYSLYFQGLLIVDSALVWIYEFENLSRDGRLDAAALVKRVAELASWSRRTAKLVSGTYPCIFAHTAPLDLLATLAMGANGKTMEKGVSPLVGREGKQILDEQLTISDDALRPFGFRAAPFDDEGSQTRTTPLFERGVFRSFLFDLKSAAATGRASTGSARRSDFTTLPVPTGSNLIVNPGTLDLKSAIAGMKEGLLVYGTVGGGQSNVLAGDFSLGISLGFKVENGAVVGRVKDAMVAGNAYEALRSINGLGSRVVDFGSASIPFFYFPALKVAARQS